LREGEGDIITLGNCCLWGIGEVLCHKRHTEYVPLGRRARGFQKIEARGEDVVWKTVHFNDG